MPNWTQDQQKAIYERGGKIIVSAAAGSGKTAVLSQRVIEYILSGGNIDDLLVVTFTNAAAFEMKQRIKNKIKDAYEKDKSDHLKRQLSLVSLADITTMDSFYGKIVKDNFEKLNIDRNFGMLSSSEETILKDRILKEIFEDFFENVPNFNDTLTFFGANDTDLIKDIVLKISSFLETIPNSKNFINKCLENYQNDFYKNIIINNIKENILLYKNAYLDIISDLEKDSIFDKMIPNVKIEYNCISNILDSTDLNSLSTNIRLANFPRLNSPQNQKDNEYLTKFKKIRDSAKEYITKKLKEIMVITDEEYEKEMNITYENFKVLFEVVENFRQKLLDEKKKINKFSFCDIAFFVIDLLIKDSKKTNFAKELSNKYKEILIDEYQDTNNLQNVIFNAISSNNSNLFIVGDVKQSIYRFRSACPEIFNNDKNTSFKDKFPKLITLSKNFRSRKEVLDFCNFIFESVMTNSFGEVTYDENEKLYLGTSFKESDNLDTEVLLIDGKKTDDDLDDELTGIQKEAILVADKIKNLLDSKYKVYDNKTNELRCVKESDIVILLRSLKYSNYFIEALNNRNISVYSPDSTVFFDNYEIKLVISILKVIDNFYDDVSLMTLVNSSLTEINLDEVVDLRKNNKYVSLYDSMLLSNNLKVKKLLNDINYLKSFTYNNSLVDIINEIYKTFDIISIVMAMKDGEKRYKNLMHLINHANILSDKTFHEFIAYVEELKLNKDSLEGINPLSSGLSVSITTIHSSKGLEYPIVILGNTGKKMNDEDLKKDLMINEELGLSVNLLDNNYKIKYESIAIKAFKDLERSKMLSEELRILYVALTRAKEKIIITGFVNNLENTVNKAATLMGDDLLVSNLYLKGVHNYLEIMMPCLLRHINSKNLRELTNVSVKTYLTSAKIKTTIIPSSFIKEDEFGKEKQIKTESFDLAFYNKMKEYDKKEEAILEYVSVSDIKHSNKFLRNPLFLSDGIKHNEIGSLYHKVLEVLPVKKYNINMLKEELDTLSNNKVITEEEKNILKLENIFAYLTSDIYDLLLNSKEVYKEKKITFTIDSNYYDKTLKSGNILTSGIIDLLFVLDDCYYIVDYKTDNVSSLDELKQLYKKQLDLYEIGIKQIMNAKTVKKYIYSIKLNKFIEV